MLAPESKQQLLVLAARSIRRGVGRSQPEPVLQEAGAPALREMRATFTTLMLAGELRGCCGSLEPIRPLAQDVWHSAWYSAYADPRFEPVAATELDALEISISVLSPLVPLPFAGEPELLRNLEPGVDGLVLASGARRATFLPTVWEMLPEPRQFLYALKRKGGWSGGALPSDARAWRYRTESFSSEHGAVLRAAGEDAAAVLPAPA